LTPSPSIGTTLPVSPSLKSKESVHSVGERSVSSGQSGNGELAADTPSPPVELYTVKGSPPPGRTDEPERHKTKKLKKYKHNAEKVFSLFSSPR
jgi:hypothetical protein